jgi:uncharacterized membrane protein YebE (DUF533 family)
MSRPPSAKLISGRLAFATVDYFSAFTYYELLMNHADYPYVVAIAMLASKADGQSGAAEQAAIDALLTRIGSPDITQVAQQVSAGNLRLADLASKLSDEDARRTAYETALAVCHADGMTNLAEQTFLEQLRDKLGLTGPQVDQLSSQAGALSGVSLTAPTGSPDASSAGDAALDELILQQAMLTGALEILPDRLANIAVLPLQLRLVYQIGQHHGQQLDANQVKDLAATLGLGAAAQAMEGVVIKVLGGLAGGLLGGLLGGAGRVAGGAAITFASTYALGHVAKQYYAQGRKISTADLKALFARFQQDAATIYPKVQEQIQSRSRTLNLQTLLGTLQGKRV